MLCSWARHFTLTLPPSIQEYKWVLANCWGNLTNCWGVTCDGLASRPGGVEILLAASCYGNQDKLWPDEPVLAPKASLSLFLSKNTICTKEISKEWERGNFKVLSKGLTYPDKIRSSRFCQSVVKQTRF